MLAAGTGAAPPMPAGAAGPYAPPFGHVPGMAPQGPPGGPGPHTVHAGNNAHVAHAAHAAHNPAGMHAGAQAPTQANPYASAQANPYGMPPAMPYGAMGGIHAHPYGNGAQYGAVSVPQPTPVVTTNGRLGKGLSPDNRELRWKLFIGQVPHEVRSTAAVVVVLVLVVVSVFVVFVFVFVVFVFVVRVALLLYYFECARVCVCAYEA